MDGPSSAIDAVTVPPRSSRTVAANGITLSYDVRGSGPPLVMIMGYRLSSDAWPQELLDGLSRRFTLITFDNRGTGRSDKPLEGYAMANMALDVRCLLDALGIERAHVLGYSMGGVIAQEFVRQFPERVSRLVLCATMCGGAVATYASPRVQNVMHDLGGLKPEDVARRIWSVTYSPRYLETRRDEAERQMRREIANPTPLHAADLQFQGIANFDGSAALADFAVPTLVLTGDLDELIPPENAEILADFIPDARLVTLEGAGHRVFWEMTDACVDAIVSFLESPDPQRRDDAEPADEPFKAVFGLSSLMMQPFALMRSMTYSTFRFMDIGFGDGKPVILVPGFFVPFPLLLMVARWLEAIGYRPTVTSGAGADVIAATAKRASMETRRKAVVVAFDFGAETAYKAVASSDHVSDLIVAGSWVSFETTPSLDVHYMRWLMPTSLVSLSRLLRTLKIELLSTVDSPVSTRQLTPPAQ